MRSTSLAVGLLLAWQWLGGTAYAQPEPVRQWIRENGPPATVNGDTLTLAPGAWVRTAPAVLDAVVHLRYRALSPEAEAAVILRAYPLRPDGKPGVGYRIPLPRAGTTTAAPITAYNASVREVDPAANVSPAAADEWQEAEVRIEGSRLTLSIGGTTARTVEASGTNHYFAGYAGLEATGGAVEFQHVTLTRLPTAGPCVPRERPRLSTPSEGEPVRVPRSGVRTPRLLKDAPPNYTPDAIARGVQGRVLLSAVVGTDGVVSDVCVQEGLDPDLDVAAVGAGRAFQFAPGTMDGQPVKVRVALEISFRLTP